MALKKQKKLYNPNVLFIGRIGNVTKYRKNEKNYLSFNEIGFAITTINTHERDKYYFDFLSAKKYINFHNEYCEVGDSAINDVVPLLLFIQKIYSNIKDIESLEKIASKIINDNKISEEELKHLLYYLTTEEEFICNTENNNTNFITILNNKNFESEQAYGRDEEFNNLILILAQDKKNPILVGPTGVGKTSLINQLAYKIKKKDIPNFIKGKKIIDISMLITNTKYTEKLEKDIKKLIDSITKEDIILIENIHLLYNSNEENIISNIIKQAIEQQSLKVIGTTTEEKYNECFYNSTIDKNFDTITINEPTDENLYLIINEVFNNYSKKNKISIFDDMDNIINVLIEWTNEKNRLFNKKTCNSNTKEIHNPELVIEIIDKIFAYAKADNRNKLNIQDVDNAMLSCKHICIDLAILKKLDYELYTTTQKIKSKKK